MHPLWGKGKGGVIWKVSGVRALGGFITVYLVEKQCVKVPFGHVGCYYILYILNFMQNKNYTFPVLIEGTA